MREFRPVRLLAYTDYAYHRVGETIYSERAFSHFLARVAQRYAGEVVVMGRLSPESTKANYAIGEDVGFIGLPWYESLASLPALLAVARSLRTGWRAVGEVDGVWLLGPHPLIIFMVAFAVLRRKRVILGVRQDFPAYIASRRPGNPVLRAAAVLLEGAFRLIARRSRVVVVGPELARHYRRARAVLPISVSLVEAERIVAVEDAATKEYGDELTILSVGRLDTEKNPLMLVDVLADLLTDDGRWRLEICGEGPLAEDVTAAADRLGISARVELSGYVPFGEMLERRYRSAHVLLHCSRTEGLPQVILEAFAAGLPVVASDVGGIREAVGESVLLIAPDDRDGATAAVRSVAADERLRAGLVEGGHSYISAHTIEAESARVARFLAG